MNSHHHAIRSSANPTRKANPRELAGCRASGFRAMVCRATVQTPSFGGHRLFIVRLMTVIVLCATGTQSLRANDSTTLASEAKEVLRANCGECHAAENAPADFHVLDHAALLRDDLIVAGSPDQSKVFQLITSTDEDAMPPPSRPSLTIDQIAVIRKWILNGANVFPADASPKPSPSPLPKVREQDVQSPADFVLGQEQQELDDDRSVLADILQHVRSLPAQDRSFVRYFSSRHLLRGGATEHLIAQQRMALAKAINHLSYQVDLVTPIAVDDVAGGTVFAIDIRKLGWHARRLLPVDPKPANGAAEEQGLTLYDLMLLEYPYAIHRDDDATTLSVTDELLKVAKQVRPIPFLRIDWFCSVVLQPPLYHDILMLPRTLAELEEQLDVDVEGNLRDGLVARGGVTISGVSRNNRVVERHSYSSGYYYKSHDFASNTGRENILIDPVGFVPSGGEMIFRLPNGCQGYFVSDARGKRIDAAPTAIVVDKFASDRVVRNGLGCIRCHDRGVKDFQDVVRDILDVLPANPGFDKQRAKRLYPTGDIWEETILNDRDKFEIVMSQLGLDPDDREPLSALTTEYLERAIHGQLAAAELGLRGVRLPNGTAQQGATSRLAAVCTAPGFTRLGLAPLGAGGVIRRDAWEDNFDAAVRSLGLGTPIVPTNGLLRTEYLNDPLGDVVTLRTNKANSLFETGDELRIFVDNESEGTIHIDLFGVSNAGQIVRLGEAGAEVAAGETFAFPGEQDNAIKIRGGLGRESITLYASSAPLPSSVIFRGERTSDRVVHQSYVIGSDSSGLSQLQSDAANIIKKTLLIETR